MSDLWGQVEAVRKAQAMFKEVPLSDELLECVEDDPAFGMQTLRHPLVVMPMFSQHLANYANQSLAARKEALAKAEAANDLHSAVFIHERPFRLQAFMDRADRMTDEVYWEALSHVWTDCEYPHPNLSVWSILWSANRAGRVEHSMDHESRETYLRLQAQPEVTLWRGTDSPKGRKGLSWTTERETAEWFANRFDGDPHLWQMTVAADRILSVQLQRGESEVVVDARKARVCRVGLVERGAE